MAEICYGVVGKSETAAAAVEPSKRNSTSRRRRLELRRPFTLVTADVAVRTAPLENGRKRRKLDLFPFPSSAHHPESSPRDCDNALQSCITSSEDNRNENKEIKKSGKSECVDSSQLIEGCARLESAEPEHEVVKDPPPKFGMTSVCGRRRDMEDTVSIHPSLIGEKTSFFGVFDGHGCSHVAMKCRDRLHEIVGEEIGKYGDVSSVEWKQTMKRSFEKMDMEVGRWNYGDNKSSNCRCELQIPQCDAVGSTAVVAVVTSDKIIVSNCGDSRAVLCRNGVAIPLSSDHKPDRPDELLRIEKAGGRVIYWDGPRVLGVLAMSRAIGDNYLKPYVISEPEVTVRERTPEDECLILASDGLWDVVSNDTACGVARMCLRAQNPPTLPGSPGSNAAVGGGAVDSSDKACSDASILLTKLALARHSMDNVSVVVADLRRNQHQ